MDQMAGVGWALLGAFFLGTFALPLKWIKNFAWENTWWTFFLVGMLIVPVGFAMVTVKGLWATFGPVEGWVIFAVVALGFLWGCGFCCWGYGLSMVGLSLGYSLTMGTMALVGSMLPFFLGNAKDALEPGGMIVILGILVCIGGVGVNGYAGMQREKSQVGGETEGGPKKKHMLAGLLICVLAGVLSSGLNIGFHIGNKMGDITNICQNQQGNPDWLAGMAIWTLVFLGGFISSVGFSTILLFKNKTWKGFKCKGSCLNLFLAAVMAIAHFACIFFYGLGGLKLGALGTSVGFAIFQSGSLLIGNGLGLATGEWKGSSAKSKRWLFIGLGVLILGVVVVSSGNAVLVAAKEAAKAAAGG